MRRRYVAVRRVCCNDAGLKQNKNDFMYIEKIYSLVRPKLEGREFKAVTPQGQEYGLT